MAYRGVNIYSYITDDEVREIISKGAKLLRYQAFVEPDLARRLSLSEWRRFLVENFIPKIDRLANICGETSTASLLIDLHNPPGGGSALNYSSDLMGAFTWTWQELASTFKDYRSVLGYGVLNEPAMKGSSCGSLMNHAVRVIRAIDTVKIISVTCPWGRPEDFDSIIYVDDPRVWYEVHFYTPMKLTHQGLYGNKPGAKYPSSDFKLQNMVRALRPMVKFQQKHQGAEIYVGEFSIDSIAPQASRENYIRDCVTMFNRYGWHWTYHCWGEHGAWEPTGHVIDELMRGWS